MKAYPTLYLILGLVSSLHLANADTIGRLNSTANLNLGTGWSGGVAPGSSDIADFWDSSVPSSGDPMPTANLGANLTWTGIVVDTNQFTSGSVIGSDGNTLTLGSSGMTINGGRQATFDCDITMSAAQSWYYDSSNNVKKITMNGNLNTQGFTLDFTGKGSKHFSGDITGGGNVDIGHSNTIFGLESASDFTFVIGADTVSTNVTGNSGSTMSADGAFTFDLSGAATIVGASWALVNVANVTTNYGSSFGVNEFSETAVDSGIWQGAANGVTYQFTESDSVLTVIPEPSSYAYVAAIGLGVLFFRFSKRKGVC